LAHPDHDRHLLPLREHVRKEAVSSVVDAERAVRLLAYVERWEIQRGMLDQPTVILGHLDGVAGLCVPISDRDCSDADLHDADEGRAAVGRRDEVIEEMRVSRTGLWLGPAFRNDA
jgi:hypothetical protein